ncbi:uncharacterized protein LOC114876928 [Osmia bicornis bicornis]|uniref:uncharacterized protein LOC114876928 n=1 Tax=Osmia bicornis bicornis TaxID=1437191 RepID=UPI0010F9C7F7|nr:uncharacterized protein LOC114876928 [Osmia bicornis bicornis]
MSLSAANVSKDKSIQEEIRSDSTMVRKPVKIVGASPSLENYRTKECNELKIERKDPKKDEETEKRKISQLQNENLLKTQKQDSKLKIVESKTIETKKTEVVVPKVLSSTTATQTFVPEFKMIPISSTSDTENPSNVAVPRKSPPLLMPVFNERPLVLTSHLVPSLPISLFQVLAEAIEVATEKPVVLLYEPRSDRPVAKDIADIAILPASGEWEDGELLPVSFCFKHHLNKDNSPCVYADVIVATDRAPHVKDITDLRGHRCSLPDRKKRIGVAALLFNFLYTRGESPAFFGNTLDAETHIATLQMVAGRQAEIGILESPVIKCHKNTLPGINSLHILTSLGPLPPYRIMVRKTLSDVLIKKVTTYLLNISQDKEWVDKFAPFGVTSFMKNSEELYDFTDVKSAVTSVPYY